MFGLEDQKKKKKAEEFVFDFEKDLTDPAKQKEYREKVEGKIQLLNEILRGGEETGRYKTYSILLQGYDALLKVMNRVIQKPKK
jgi:hypothetical protein